MIFIFLLGHAFHKICVPEVACRVCLAKNLSDKATRSNQRHNTFGMTDRRSTILTAKIDTRMISPEERKTLSSI